MSSSKLIEEVKKMSVADLAKLIKELETEFGVSAAAPAAAAPAAAAAAPAVAQAEEKSEYKVTLKETGANKINVIKALRTVTTLSLGAAKEAVENVPFVVAEAASKDDAQKMKKALEEAGAKVELV
jgi:large subunit ribosomal protein L7/L12